MLVSRNQNIEDYSKNKDDNIHKKQCLKQKFSGHKKQGKKKMLMLISGNHIIEENKDDDIHNKRTRPNIMYEHEQI